MATKAATPEVMDTKSGQSVEDQPLDQPGPSADILQQQLPPRSIVADPSTSPQEPPEEVDVKEPYNELLQVYGRGACPKIRTEEGL